MCKRKQCTIGFRNFPLFSWPVHEKIKQTVFYYLKALLHTVYYIAKNKKLFSNSRDLDLLELTSILRVGLVLRDKYTSDERSRILPHLLYN
jgi:hypothetical protein